MQERGIFVTVRTKKLETSEQKGKVCLHPSVFGEAMRTSLHPQILSSEGLTTKATHLQ